MQETATTFRLTRPFRIDAFDEAVAAPRRGELLLRPVRAGICGSDLKLYTGTRERSALMKKLPIALLHEAVAEVVAADPGSTFSPGDRVVPSPSIPCTVAHPDRHPTLEEACFACRPGGVGENYCVDGYFLSSNTDGMARTAFVHPESCTVPIPDTVDEAVAVLTEPFATALTYIVPLPTSAAAAADAGTRIGVEPVAQLEVVTVVVGEPVASVTLPTAFDLPAASC